MLIRVGVSLVMLSILQQSSPFKSQQLRNERVKAAYAEKEQVVKDLFTQRKLSYTSFELFIRAFKREKEVEVWVKPKASQQFALLTSYPICANSGTLGPKRKEGDLQVPEGVYHINHFNPQSNFHLSLGVSYPNGSDKILSDQQHPGGAIYVHGNCVTIGCIPITDDKIKELYVLAVEAKNSGQEKIPIHIFPTKLSAENLSMLKNRFDNPVVVKFWENLQPVYEYFERSKTLPLVKVNKQGEYVFETAL